MKKTKFLSVIAVGALLLGTGLTSCAQEECPLCEECKEPTDIHHYGVTIVATTGGTITPSKETAKEGEDITLTATPAENHSLTSLKIDGTERITEVQDNKLTVKVGKASIKVEATFSENVYKINITETENGTITSSIAEGNSGDKVSFKVTPNDGFELDTFTVDGADKKAELVDGVFETTITSADITVAATFKSLDLEGLIGAFIAKTTRASELEASGIVNKAKYTNVSTMTTETTYEKFTNDIEGDYSVVTDLRKNASGKYTTKQVVKTTLKEDTLFKITQSFAVKDEGFETEPSSTDLSSTTGTSIEVNEGKGYLAANLFGGYAGKFTEAKLKAGQHLKISFEGSLLKVSYDALATDWSGVETYTLTEGTFTFDGEKITSAIEKVSAYTTGFEKDEEGNVTLTEEAEAKVQSKELTFEYGEAKAELPEFAELKYGDLATTTITTKFFEIVNYTQEVEINSLDNLFKTHTYKVKLAGDADREFDPLTLEVVPDYGQDANNISAYYSSWANEITINSTGTFSGTLVLKTFNVTESIPVVITEPAVESLELGVPNYDTGAFEKTATVGTGSSTQLGLTVNPIGASDKVAFSITGAAAEGCKVVAEEIYGSTAYTFTAGQTEGEVVVRAISTADSSIVSNDLVITIGQSGTLPEEGLFGKVPGQYQTGESDTNWLVTPLTLGELAPDPEGGYAGTYSGAGTSGGSYYFSEDGMGALITFGSGAQVTVTIDGSQHDYVIYGFMVEEDTTGVVTLKPYGMEPVDETAPSLSSFVLYKIS